MYSEFVSFEEVVRPEDSKVLSRSICCDLSPSSTCNLFGSMKIMP